MTPISQIVLEQEKRLQNVFDEMKDWCEGTVGKQYDREETIEAIREDIQSYYKNIVVLMRELSSLTLDAAIAEIPETQGAEALAMPHSIERLGMLGEAQGWNNCRTETIQRLSALKGRVLVNN